jgi:N-acetylglucosamine-6-phosphate deacetylase
VRSGWQPGSAVRHGSSAPTSKGPFLSPDRAGAHPPALLRAPDADLLETYLHAGPVTMITLAPELDGALELVEMLAARGIVVSLGHTNANAALAREAFDRGAASVTHLFNAMRQFHHRDPGIVGAALTRQDVVVQLIADGVHVDPEAVLAAWHVARGRLVLVSDAIAAAGCGDGTYTLGGTPVAVADGVARTADGELAGGVRPLSAGLRLLLELDVPLDEAVDAVTRAPARLLGRTDVGVLAVGAPADIVVLDDELQVERVYVGGAHFT